MHSKQTKKSSNIYPTIKLTLYIKLLLAAHFFLFFTLLMDLIPLINFKERSEFARKLPDILIGILKYKPDSDITAALLSSLLVVWTFITAVVIFYMEKKDNIYCGIRTWDIVSFDIGRSTKIISAVIFFIELFLILLAFVLDFSCTLIYFLLLYPATAGCIFGLVCWATAEHTIKKRYYDKILHEYHQCSRNYPATSMERVPSLTIYLNGLSSFTEKDWDLLINLLLNIFVSLCSEDREDKRTDAKRILYTIISYILDNTSDTNQKIKFLKNLSIKTYEKVKDAPSAIDILTVISLPAAAFRDNSRYCYYTSCFSVIPDDIFSHQLLLRGIVYSAYLAYTTGSHLYSAYCSQLQSYLGPTDPRSEKEDWRRMRFFAYKLRKYNHRFTPVVLDQYIHR